MSMIPIGELKHRFALQAPQPSPDGGGGESVAWSLEAEVWGALRPISAGDTFEADGRKGRATHEIVIRHRAGVSAALRFVLGPRVFQIRSVIDVAERGRFLRCLVEERTS